MGRNNHKPPGPLVGDLAVFSCFRKSLLSCIFHPFFWDLFLIHSKLNLIETHLLDFFNIGGAGLSLADGVALQAGYDDDP